jgi:hypothetical protein
MPAGQAGRRPSPALTSRSPPRVSDLSPRCQRRLICSAGPSRPGGPDVPPSSQPVTFRNITPGPRSSHRRPVASALDSRIARATRVADAPSARAPGRARGHGVLPVWMWQRLHRGRHHTGDVSNVRSRANLVTAREGARPDPVPSERHGLHPCCLISWPHSPVWANSRMNAPRSPGSSSGSVLLGTQACATHAAC